jgi:hypothetical protein
MCKCPKCKSENDVEYLDSEKADSYFMNKLYVKTTDNYTCTNCMKCFSVWHAELKN